MAWSPPIKRRENRHLLKDERFFKLLAEECSRFADRDTAYLVYMMMVGVIGKQLKHNGIARLPHLGDFGVVEQKSRPGWMGRNHIRMEPRKVLRFYTNYFFRRTFNKRQDF